MPTIAIKDQEAYSDTEFPLQAARLELAVDFSVEVPEAAYNRFLAQALRSLADRAEEYLVSWSNEDEEAWLQAMGCKQAVQVPGTNIRFRAHCLKPVLEFYGVGKSQRRKDQRGYGISPWKMERVLRWKDGLDLRGVFWMRDRYLFPEQYARLVEEHGL